VPRQQFQNPRVNGVGKVMGEFHGAPARRRVHGSRVRAGCQHPLNDDEVASAHSQKQPLGRLVADLRGRRRWLLPLDACAHLADEFGVEGNYCPEAAHVVNGVGADRPAAARRFIC
jgi:hypothetical protein